ncbi:hypothetical protein ACS0TY_035808 [Phlomoides rotata]
MSLSFRPFNYLSNISCCVSKHTKMNPSLLKLPSSIIPPPKGTETSSKINTSCTIPSGETNGIGIIGGLSVDSSLNFAKKLVDFQSENEGNSAPFVLCSDPLLSNALSSNQRSSYSSIVENLRRKRLLLEKSQVRCIVMPCHVSHSWYDEIEEGCSVPFLHVGECVAKQLKEEKLRPLEAGSPLRIGVLSTNQTFVPRFYQEKFEEEGFEVILPDKATTEHTIIPAVAALKRKDYEGAQNLFRIALQFLLVRAVNKVILASDDLQQLLPADDPLWRRCIDPMDALARSCIKIARSTETAF